MTHYGRGRTLAAAGRTSDALACFEEAKSRFTTLNDQPRLISAFVAIGTLLAGSRRHREARDAFSSALQLQRGLSLHRDAAATLRRIARECAALGDAIGARNAAEAASDTLAQTVRDPNFSDLANGPIGETSIGHWAASDEVPVRSSWSCSLH